MDIQECIESGCEVVAIETFMSDRHQKLIDDSFDILKRYEEHIVSAIASKNCYNSEKEKALLIQKTIVNDERRRVILSRIEDMYNAFSKTRIIIKSHHQGVGEEQSIMSRLTPEAHDIPR